MAQAEPPRSKEEAYLAEVRQSRAWSLLEMALKFRRDELFRTNLTDTSAILVNRGAIQEVQRMLDGPGFILEFFREQREQVERAMGAPAAPQGEQPWFTDVGPDTRPTE